MAKLLSTLILLFSLLVLAEALVPRAPTGTVPNDFAAKRQTNRKKIAAREFVKRWANVMQGVQEHNSGPNWKWHQPQTSGKTYPTCKKSPIEYPGIARYKGWDLKGDDLPGNPVHLSKKSEELCLDACFKQTFKDWKEEKGHKKWNPSVDGDWANTWEKTCVGVTYAPNSTYGQCYLKGLQVSKGKFTNKSYGAKQENTHLDLIGGCAAWAPYVPYAMDKICCDSV